MAQDQRVNNEGITLPLEIVKQVSLAIEQVPIENEASECSSQSQVPSPCSSTKKRKRKLRSPMWHEFAEFQTDGKDWATCHHCKFELQATSKKGITSLIKHLENCMMRKCEDILQQLLGSKDINNDGAKDILQQLLGAKDINNDGIVTFGNYTFDQEFLRKRWHG